jgi:hypothetical protein
MVSIITGAIFGIVPAIHASRTDKFFAQGRRSRIISCPQQPYAQHDSRA